MTSLPKSAYIPPHIRKRVSINEPSASSASKSIIINKSPDVSEKSRTLPPTQLGSSPHSVKASPKSPESLPTTAHEPEMPNNDKETDIWAYKNPPSSKARNGKNQNWRNWNGAPKKKTVWPKARDMKYVPPENGSDGGISFRSHSNGDPDYDVKKLLDWNGDWLPPPVEWSERRIFSNRHFGRDIEDWINKHPKQCYEKMDLDSDAYKGLDGICKELVPRYWMTALVEGKSMRQFWLEMADRAPDTLSDIDFTADEPWWNLFDGSRSCFINGLKVPEAKVDFHDAENHVNPSGFATAQERIQERMERMQRKQQRMVARLNRPVPDIRSLMPKVKDRSIQLTLNVYLRPVQPADVSGITEIYNYYVKDTIHANEFDPRSEPQIRDRINDVTSRGLPYLVAVAKSNPNFKRQNYITEKIVGYISLNEYCDQSSMYRYTFDMELFVHPGYTHKGIAKCLLDRLLIMTSPSYVARGGYEYVNNFEYLKFGPTRVVKTILLNIHHDHNEDTKWASEYLAAFKFVRVGHLSHIGYKHNHDVDLSIYQHHTDETINAGGLPTVALERG